jgi:hypothetical protein
MQNFGMTFDFKFILAFVVFSLPVTQSFSQGQGSGERFEGNSGGSGEVPPPPDYSNIRSWASHPSIYDMGDSIPRPLRKEYSYDSQVDVFFVHPTTYLRKVNNQMNADIENETVNDRTDRRTILNQASAFNEYRLFAPRYRQANYSAYLSLLAGYQDVFDTAYADIKKAFQYYLTNWNQGRPFFIASHSQGSQHAVRLIKEAIEGTPLEKRLVASYIIGMPPVKTFKLKLPVCSDSTQTGCYVAWNTFTEDFKQQFSFLGRSELETVNPLTWKTTASAGIPAMHKGAVVDDFNSVRPHVLSAQIKSNKLVISSHSDSIEIPDRIENLHVLDINLFYVDIRNNLRTRVAAYKKKNGSL